MEILLTIIIFIGLKIYEIFIYPFIWCYKKVSEFFIFIIKNGKEVLKLIGLIIGVALVLGIIGVIMYFAVNWWAESILWTLAFFCSFHSDLSVAEIVKLINAEDVVWHEVLDINSWLVMLYIIISLLNLPVFLFCLINIVEIKDFFVDKYYKFYGFLCQNWVLAKSKASKILNKSS